MSFFEKVPRYLSDLFVCLDIYYSAVELKTQVTGQQAPWHGVITAVTCALQEWESPFQNWDPSIEDLLARRLYITYTSPPCLSFYLELMINFSSLQVGDCQGPNTITVSTVDVGQEVMFVPVTGLLLQIRAYHPSVNLL